MQPDREFGNAPVERRNQLAFVHLGFKTGDIGERLVGARTRDPDVVLTDRLETIELDVAIQIERCLAVRLNKRRFRLDLGGDRGRRTGVRTPDGK